MKFRSFLLMALLPVAAAQAEVVLPKILTSHMVVQRDLPVHIWGTATAGEEVAVSFRGETRSAKTNELGRWSVYLSPGAAGGPFEIAVKGSASPAVVLSDVLVGDVWVAGGQSNMEFDLRRAATAAADLPHAGIDAIRLLMINKKAAEYPVDDAETQGWSASTPDSAAPFSAVAWYFAREVQQKEHVPIGVIDSTWGGTMVESWTRLTALGEDASLAQVFVSRGRMTDRESTALLEDKLQQQQIAAAKAAGKPAPQFPWHPMLAMWGPSLLYNGMIAPLTPFPIRGVIWYQGESNSKVDRKPGIYNHIFRAMIEDWRKQWGEGDFPFLFTQISNFKSGPDEDWATLREQQRKTLEMRNTAMAVTIDIGNPDDVHPTNKLDVGLRLARAARAVAYGESIEYYGPAFRQVTTEGAAIRVWFDHAQGLQFKDGLATGFEVAGTDGKFVAATAKIEGQTIVVNSADVAEPVAVRYGWANSPQCHLFNAENLPASPFTSEK